MHLLGNEVQRQLGSRRKFLIRSVLQTVVVNYSRPPKSISYRPQKVGGGIVGPVREEFREELRGAEPRPASVAARCEPGLATWWTGSTPA